MKARRLTDIIAYSVKRISKTAAFGIHHFKSRFVFGNDVKTRRQPVLFCREFAVVYHFGTNEAERIISKSCPVN